MKIALPIVLILVCARSTPAITIDTVPVGNVGNANDPLTGRNYGGVNYSYSIGKYEVTVGQYAAFLNAVAATDTYGLYDPHMATVPEIAGISRSDLPGSYTYSVIGSPNHPVTFVNWGAAARFANWLHNGQPTGPQGPGTTEDGAYALNGANSTTTLNLVTRGANARWFIPTESEWYKAAYHQPASQGGDSDNYWRQAMRTNSDPFSDQPPGATPDNTRVGNLNINDDLANGYNDGYAVTGSTTYDPGQNLLTDVGAYTSSSSYYGTFDQGGNVFEWNETLFAGFPGRVNRGGSWKNTGSGSGALVRVGNEPLVTDEGLGFRVATIFVPEPASAVLLIAGLFGFISTRRRR